VTVAIGARTPSSSFLSYFECFFVLSNPNGHFPLKIFFFRIFSLSLSIRLS